MATSDVPSPRISLDEDDSRPWVAEPAQIPKYNTGDKVYLKSGQGPYLVVVNDAGKITLSLESGETVNGGAEIDPDDLKAA